MPAWDKWLRVPSPTIVLVGMGLTLVLIGQFFLYIGGGVVRDASDRAMDMTSKALRFLGVCLTIGGVIAAFL